jgi:hypothetical protein
MSVFSIPHTLIRNLVLYFGPFIIMATVIVVNLPNPDVHKNALKYNNFYNQISTEMKVLEIKLDESQTNQITKSSQEAYNNFVWQTVGKNLASPQWIQDIVEKNLDLIGTWLKGKTDNLELYYPKDQVDKEVNKEITNIENSKTPNQFVENFNAFKGFLGNQIDKLKQPANDYFTNCLKPNERLNNSNWK